MKKALFFTMLVVGTLLFSGCEIFLTTPAIQRGKPVTIDDSNGATDTVDPHAAGRFEVQASGQPLRIDVYQENPGPDGELEVRVNDKSNIGYAHTNNRNYFQSTEIQLSNTGIHADGPIVNAPYSINLPANFGKAYILVYNRSQVAQDVTVKVFTRNEVVRDNENLSGPPASGPKTSETYGGALLFLGQKDTYVYTGPDNYTLSFSVPSGDFVKARLVINGDTNNPVKPGDRGIALLSGDKFEVASEGLERAGFCSTTADPACTDGIDSGEYSIVITRN